MTRTLSNIRDGAIGRRRFGAMVATAAAVAGLPLRAGASSHHEAAKRERGLTLYTDQPSENVEKQLAAFKAKYPGVDVEFFRGDTTQVYQRFQTESAAGRHLADVVTSTVRRARHMQARNMLGSYKSDELARYPAELIPPHHLWAVYSITTTGFAWNTRQVPAGQQPKDWDDLLDPKWRGKIGMQDPLQGGGVASWIATMYGAWGEAKWTDYMTRLAAQQPRYGRYLQIQDLLGGGEIAVQCAAYPDYIESSMKSKGAPVEWGVPNPVVRTTQSISLSANAPKPNAGKLFIDYMLSEAAQQQLASFGRLPALQSQWPAMFDRLKSATFVDSADQLEEEKQDFFQAKMKEFFGRR